MPLFRYICDKCRNDFEVLQLRSDEEVRCPKCGSLRNTRQASRIGGIRSTGLPSCAGRGDCHAAESHECCGGCCHHNH